MKNADFYAFCRDNRKTEQDVHRKEALQSVYGFMWECGVTKGGVQYYIDSCIYRCHDNQPLIEAYNWLLHMFRGDIPAALPGQSNTLF